MSLLPAANIRPDQILPQYLLETLSQPQPRDMSRQVSRFVTSLSRGAGPVSVLVTPPRYQR